MGEGMAKKGHERESDRKGRRPAELPEGRPRPGEASPGGAEGAGSEWTGGASNIGEVLNPPPPDADTAYSTKGRDDIPRVETVLRFLCDQCGEAFQTDDLLNVHRRTAHRPRP